MLQHQIKHCRALAVALILCTGCAASPDLRLVALGDEIQALRARSQDIGVLRALESADQLCREASAEVVAQRDRFWAARTYRRVGRLLDDAEVHLMSARTASTQARLRTEREARDGVSAARRELASVVALLDAFPVGRDTLDDRARMRRDVVALRTALARARQAAVEGDPRTAVAVAAGVVHEARLVAAFAVRAADLALPEVERANQETPPPGPPTFLRPRMTSTGFQGSSAIERTSTLPVSSSVGVPPL